MSVFAGFSEPQSNYSKLPHEFINMLPSFTSQGELAVVLYTLRHTWGFQEFDAWEAKAISTDEYMNGRKRIDGTRVDNGTGLSKPTVLRGLNSATEHGFIIRYVDNTDLGRVTHYYRLRTPNDKDTPDTIYACDPNRKGVSPWHNIPAEVKQAVYKRFQGRCAYCERKSGKWHYDHIYPQVKGGTDDFENLALACPQCNMSKHDKTPDEWGRDVVFYEGDVKIVYRGWSRNVTGGGNETLPRSEKETKERNSEIDIAAGAEHETLTDNASKSVQEKSLGSSEIQTTRRRKPKKTTPATIDPLTLTPLARKVGWLWFAFSEKVGWDEERIEKVNTIVEVLLNECDLSSPDDLQAFYDWYMGQGSFTQHLPGAAKLPKWIRDWRQANPAAVTVPTDDEIRSRPEWTAQHEAYAKAANVEAGMLWTVVNIDPLSMEMYLEFNGVTA